MPISRHRSGHVQWDFTGEGSPVGLIMGYVYASALRHEALNAPLLRSIGCVDAQAASK